MLAHPTPETAMRDVTGPQRATLTSSDSVRGPSSWPVIPNRFRLLEKLGQGGMGVVYRAFDSELRHEVALKSINLASPDDLYHLKQEFRLLADLRHPNLVRVHELFADGCHAFFTMELLFGTGLHSYVHDFHSGADPRCDYRRLRVVARELASAVSAVHAAGSLHRDVKPSNIIVTPAGRVVLFDFGLGAPLSPQRLATEMAGVLLGTRGYISPEQARGEALTTAADWYSFGVTLFEAATGHLPFDEPFKPFLPDPRDAELARISRYLPDVPPAFDDLVAALLDPIAEHRPSEGEIFDLLGAPSTPCPARSGTIRVRRPGSVGGPAGEQLRRAMDRVRDGKSAILCIHGTAGAGKTELARECVESAKSRGALVLRGRRRLQESVAFSAVDEVIDDLSQALHRLLYAELASLLPPDVATLPRLFPVLGRLEATQEAARPSGDDDATALRRARHSLRELLAGLADSRPVVVWIDDAQWGDRESGELLGEMLRSSDGPPILLLLSYRNDEAQGLGMLEALGRAEIDAPSFDVIVEPSLGLPSPLAWCHP